MELHRRQRNDRVRGGVLDRKNQMLNSDAEALVYIFGPRKLQNELMCEFLERSTGLTCMCWANSAPAVFDKRTDQKSLILWDCIDTDPASVWPKLDTHVNLQHFVALFNVIPDLEIYREAVNRGVRGIFFKNEKPYVFTLGVRAILNGELWFSRDILSKCLLETGDDLSSAQHSNPQLTVREKQILTLVASGNTNDKIAEELHISPHTVKTHVYNIYKKINVSNRLNAALWATKNL